ncbi:hypothetical protein LXL04_016130 [Taraxacum kok-saghyz]
MRKLFFYPFHSSQHLEASFTVRRSLYSREGNRHLLQSLIRSHASMILTICVSRTALNLLRRSGSSLPSFPISFVFKMSRPR